MNATARRARAAAPLPGLADRALACPRCETRSLVELERDGVIIDRCTRCRGVWLDRGELEHLLALARDQAEVDDDEATRPLARLAVTDERGERDDEREARPRRRTWWDLFD